MSTVDLTPLTRGLAVLDHLPDDLARLGDAGLSDLLGSLLRLRAKTEGAAVAVLMKAEQRGVVAASTAVDAGAWLRGVAQDADIVISGAEGRGWREVAGTCARPDMTVLSDAVTSGRLPVASAATLVKDLRQVRSHVPAVTWDACLGEFVDYAAAGASPKRLAQLRERVIDQYGEGDEPQRRERLAFERRGLTPFRPDGYGGGVATWTLDAASIAVVEATMDALAAPNPGRYASTDDCCADQPDNSCADPADKAAFDSRTVSQRRADALVELCQVIATNPGELGGIRPTFAARAQVVVTIDYDRLVDQLRDRQGQGHSTGMSAGTGPRCTVTR